MAEKEGFAPGTGAVPAPALGAEKPFTRWFFASAGSGRALLTPPSFMQHEKETAYAISFSWRRRRDSPPALGQCRRQPGALKNHSPDGFSPPQAPAAPFSPLLLLLPRKKAPYGAFFRGGEGVLPYMCTIWGFFEVRHSVFC